MDTCGTRDTRDRDRRTGRQGTGDRGLRLGTGTRDRRRLQGPCSVPGTGVPGPGDGRQGDRGPGDRGDRGARDRRQGDRGDRGLMSASDGNDADTAAVGRAAITSER